MQVQLPCHIRSKDASKARAGDKQGVFGEFWPILEKLFHEVDCVQGEGVVVVHEVHFPLRVGVPGTCWVVYKHQICFLVPREIVFQYGLIVEEYVGSDVREDVDSGCAAGAPHEPDQQGIVHRVTLRLNQGVEQATSARHVVHTRVHLREQWVFTSWDSGDFR